MDARGNITARGHVPPEVLAELAKMKEEGVLPRGGGGKGELPLAPLVLAAGGKDAMAGASGAVEAAASVHTEDEDLRRAMEESLRMSSNITPPSALRGARAPREMPIAVGPPPSAPNRTAGSGGAGGLEAMPPPLPPSELSSTAAALPEGYPPAEAASSSAAGADKATSPLTASAAAGQAARRASDAADVSDPAENERALQESRMEGTVAQLHALLEEAHAESAAANQRAEQAEAESAACRRELAALRAQLEAVEQENAALRVIESAGPGGVGARGYC